MDPNQPNQEPFPGDPGPNGPYGPGGPYGLVPNGQVPPPPGWPPQSYSYGYPPYPYVPQAFPTVMPGTVRAARIVLFVVSGIGVLVTVVQGTMGDPDWRSYMVGFDIVLYLLIWIMALLACFYTSGRNGIRITTIVLCVLQGLSSLGQMSAAGSGQAARDAAKAGTGYAGPLYGVLTFGTALLVLILLSQGVSGRWFKRPRF
ncbi:hypothetical protein [Nocardia concava]|uniref:hypothetical protein n=1 Tax=Nocardia concava TaxID=257281 RepID=UPI00031F8595|nr:hypothetical protein [Nocardia concava]